MPDEQQEKVTLEWVEAPHIAQGRVVYKYRNSSNVTANIVSEQVNALHDGAEAQAFQLQDLAGGAEQETHAPLGHDLPDGEIAVHVSISAARTGGSDWDAELTGEVKGHGEGGRLQEGPPAQGAAAHAPVSIDLTGVEVTSDELVVTYRVEGGPETLTIACFVMLEHDGQMRWTGGEGRANQRDGVLRLGVPFDLVDGDGWRAKASFTAMDLHSNDDGGAGAVELQVQLAYEDGQVSSGGYAVETVSR